MRTISSNASEFVNDECISTEQQHVASDKMFSRSGMTKFSMRMIKTNKSTDVNIEHTIKIKAHTNCESKQVVTRFLIEIESTIIFRRTGVCSVNFSNNSSNVKLWITLGWMRKKSPLRSCLSE